MCLTIDMEQTHPSAGSFTTKATAEVTKFVIKVDGVDICEIFKKIYNFYIPRNQLGLAINNLSQEILPRCKYILPRSAPISGIGS